MAPVWLCFLSFSSLLILSSSSSTPDTLGLSLTPIVPTNSSSNSWEFISHITKTSLARAQHLKKPKISSSKPSSVVQGSQDIPVSARSFGGYTVPLSLGTPSQTIPLVFDTGSSLVWVPCTSRYVCKDCSFAHTDPTKIPHFIPKLSSTKRILDCSSPKCALVLGSKTKPGNCSRACPGYLIQYGLGATTGLPITDTLKLPHQVVPDFLFGCSVESIHQPAGIAGFGRAPSSLPNQLKLKKFSYCLLSHKFNDQPKSSDLILVGSGKTVVASGVSYTPLGKNPGKPPYDEYYYVYLNSVTVGKKEVKLPVGILKPGLNGNGGTIVDSGTTLTYMEKAAFDPVAAEFAAQMGKYKRFSEVEALLGLGLCYDVSKEHTVALPELVFNFEGGAKMELPLSNYLLLVSDLGALCLSIVSSSSSAGPQVPVGPAIILGNIQQQNFYVEYDLENQRLGFKQQQCA